MAGKNLSTNFQQFEENVLKKFTDLQRKASKASEKETTDTMVELLKQFHIYWNGLRLNNDLARAKGETKNIMKKIMQNYQMKESMLFEFSKTFAKKIRQAYANFIKAHLTHQILKSKAPDMLAQEIVERFKNSIAVLEREEFRNRFVEKVADLIFLTESFYTIAYRVGYSRQRCLEQLRVLVEEPIKNHYIEITAGGKL